VLAAVFSPNPETNALMQLQFEWRSTQPCDLGDGYLAARLAARDRPVLVDAVIAAAVALAFEVRTWRGALSFPPDAITNVSARDFRRHLSKNAHW
jgi:hypothetical protein